MDRVGSAVSFGRALWALGRAGSTGVLEVAGDAQRCRIALVEGTPRAATALRADGTLGDALLSEGDLDLVRHGAALLHAPPSGPVGDWLVAQRVASRPAVELALRVQLRRRILRIFAFREIEFHFVSGSADVGLSHVGEPVAAADLVLGGMRRVLRDSPPTVLRGQLPGPHLRLSEAGCALLSAAALFPSEAAMLPLLLQGATTAALHERAQGCPRARTLLTALGLLGLLHGRRGQVSGYALLARKRRELRSRRPAHALLDLPPDAGPGEARRALRRLALQLHPDRLDPDAPGAVRRASTEVMGALIAAESRLRRCRPA